MAVNLQIYTSYDAAYNAAYTVHEIKTFKTLQNISALT